MHDERQGLFIGYCSTQRGLTFKVEKHPKEVPHGPAHAYPRGTPQWLRIWAVHLPRIPPGKSWRSQPVILLPHEGDWHAGADRYLRYRHENLQLCEPPAWMKSFVGWTEILGKTYLGEVFHDYARCASAVVKDKRVTGLDLLFDYGHSNLGAEGADFDCSPAPDPGGEAGFSRMLEKLHRSGIRIVLLDHLHWWVNSTLGVDGLELDTFNPSPCYNPRHGHPPGQDMLPAKIEFMRQVRSLAKRLNPDFALIGETMRPETREVLDGNYASRLWTERGRIYCYQFPELREQTVTVGNYAYDRVNKALMLGIGLNTEIWGLRRTALDGCPELAKYIGQVNRLRRRHADILIRGTFCDTVGAAVTGDCLYSVLLGPFPATENRFPSNCRSVTEGTISPASSTVLPRPML